MRLRLPLLVCLLFISASAAWSALALSFVAPSLNGEGEAKDLELNLSFLSGQTGTMIAAGEGGTAENPSFRREELTVPADGKVTVSVGPNDGFVVEFGE